MNELHKHMEIAYLVSHVYTVIQMQYVILFVTYPFQKNVILFELAITIRSSMQGSSIVYILFEI